MPSRFLLVEWDLSGPRDEAIESHHVVCEVLCEEPGAFRVWRLTAAYQTDGETFTDLEVCGWNDGGDEVTDGFDEPAMERALRSFVRSCDQLKDEVHLAHALHWASVGADMAAE
jgi:hypothetical protein